MNRLMLAGVAGLVVGCSGGSDEVAVLRGNIGKIACNATNGVYVGRIVDVTSYNTAGQATTLIYVVERDGRRRNAPTGNTVIVDGRCPVGQPELGASIAASGPERAAAPLVKVDPALSSVALEFSQRLGVVQGELLELRSVGGSIAAKWSSKHCDMTEGEVIDFLLSLNRGHPAVLTESIQVERICDGSVRTFGTTGSRFQEYRTGRINDVEILRGLR